MSTKILELTIDNALKAHREGDSKDKQLLEKLYGKEVFNQKITDRVKTFEDACEVLGISPSCVLTSYSEADELAYRKLKIIAKALNEGWTPDWNNSNQYKYYPYFDMSNGFSFFAYDCYYQGSHVGSRLCFKSDTLARYAGQTFVSLYKELFTIQ